MPRWPVLPFLALGCTLVNAELRPDRDAAGSPSILDVGSRKQLFLDRRLIETDRNIQLVFNPPRHLPENVLPAEGTWERGRLGAYVSVIEEGAGYRMYYNAYDARFETEYLCVALSDDGVRWRRPRIGTIEHDGSRDNNIVGIGVRGRVFVDPFDAAARRYKLLARMDRDDPRWPPSKGTRRTDASYMLTSSDGFTWQRVEEPVLGFSLASMTDVVWDDLAGRWAIYARQVLPDGATVGYGRLEVARDALLRPFPVTPAPWSGPPRRAVDLRGELPFVLRPDERDPNGSNIYTLYAQRYRGADAVFVAFPSIWYSRGRAGRGDPSASDGMEMQFAHSRDGSAWQRPVRRSIVPLWSEPGPTAVDQVYCGGMVRRGDELVVFYNRVAGRHLTDPWKPLGPRSMIGRVVFRLDGFVSAEAGSEGGELTTRALTFAGRRLEINAWVGAGGSVRVALLDAGGRPLPGFDLADSVGLEGNSVRHAVAWKQGSDVAALAGRPVRLRIALRDAKLFALQFQP
jgi:hypothetical protein